MGRAMKVNMSNRIVKKNLITGMILLMATTFSQASPLDEGITYEVIPANQINSVLPLFKKMRVDNYYHFPYLYVSKGTDQEETTSYEQSLKRLMVVAKNDNNIEALAVAIPLADIYNKTLDISGRKLFEKALGKNIDHYFYISELLFADTKPSDGKKDEIAKNLVKRIESEIIHDKSFDHVSMLVVERPQDHPLRHELFLDESKILKELGYAKTNYVTQIAWTVRIDKNKTEHQDNTLTLWSKKIIER